MSTLALVMLGIVACITVIIALIALNNRVIFKLGLRNIMRRPGQSLLIIAGLTLSTVTITSALGTGDTQASSLRAQATSRLGMIDEQILGPVQGPLGKSSLTQAQYDELSAQLSGDSQIDGVAPLFSRNLALTAPAAGQGEPIASIFATDDRYEKGFGGFLGDADTPAPTLAALADDEVYINDHGALALNVRAGDTIELHTSATPVTMRVKAIIRNQGLLTSGGSVVVMPLERARTLYQAPDELSALLVSNSGGLYDSVDASEAVTKRVRLLVTKPEIAEDIRAMLATPEALAMLEARLKELEKVQPPNKRLIEQARMLQIELKSPQASDQMRSVLADNEFAGWLGSLPLPGDVQAELSTNLTALSRFQVNDEKARSLAEAELQGSIFFSLFLIVGTFSIIAGLLLIFLIFVMLAAERKSELGMARAIGMQRRHLVQAFLSEGVSYSLFATLLGVVLGIGVCWVMVNILAGALNHFEVTTSRPEIDLRFAVSPFSIVIAFCLGLTLTFFTIAFSSWRVSRLNIVAAIRNLPDLETNPRRSSIIWRLVRALFVLIMGTSSIAGAYSVKQMPVLFSGVSFVIIGLGLLLRWIIQRTPWRQNTITDRVIYTAMGLGLVLLWMFPALWHPLFQSASFDVGAGFFIAAGLFAVLGGVWLVVFNSDLLLGLLNVIFGRFGSLAPVMKIATAYSLMSRFRTGMTLAMFGLITFLLVTLSIINTANTAVFNNRTGITGGYDIVATVDRESALDNLQEAIRAQSTLDANAFLVVTAASQAPYEIRQLESSKQAWQQFPVAAVEPTYYEHVASNFSLTRVSSFADDAAVWKALRERDDVVLLLSTNVPSRQFHIKPQGYYEVEGGFIEDPTLPPYQMEIRVPGTEQVRKLQVVGALKTPYTLPFVGIMTNKATLEALTGTAIKPNLYVLQTAPGRDSLALARQLEQTFLTSGLDATEMNNTITQVQAGNNSINSLSKGFLALGFFVGIAALGVIASRSVYERRQQIGMLRALGYQGRMVLLAFLVESSFIALLGLALGTFLGVLLGSSIVTELARQIGVGLTFRPPWSEILTIVGASYVFSLLATYMPAYKASKIYPAEALRYD
ncbi:MAG: FtsX-like permease family protein [Herpetosiphonaceae bacterium]|nr:FtsX-like permease family protein [Herpetosiphonaceae bacterium]